MQFLHNLRLKHKIIASFLLVIFLTFVILGFAVDKFFTRTTTDLADKYTLQGIEQVNTSIEAHVENIESIINMLARDSSVLEFLSWNLYREDTQGHTIRSNVRNILTTAVENSSDMTGIVVVNAHDFYISNEMYHHASSPIVQESWYQQCTKSEKLSVFRPEDDRILKYFFSPGADNLVCIAKPIYLPGRTAPAGAVLVDLNVAFMQKIIENATWDKTGFVYILGTGRDVVFAPVNDVVPRIKPIWFEENAAVFQKNLGRKRYEFVFAKSAITQWKAVGVFSLESTLKPIFDFRLFMVLLFVGVGLLASMVIAFFSRSIVKPILSLNNLMQKAAAGDLDVRFRSQYTDEIGELGRSFNTMVAELKNLIELVRAEQRSKRKAELQVLQEQIKPHFLYNTFDTIHWIAKGYGATEIVDIVKALTSILRVGLSRGRDIITLQDELTHAKSYLTVQKIRYGDKFSYQVIAPANAQDFLVQKLILQPLIENALYHGLKNRRGTGHLLVKVQLLPEKLVLSVTDNGPGISPQRLATIRESLENGNKDHIGFGLFNVSERLRISYGSEYGIKINTQPGHFTHMEIAHPLVPQKKEAKQDEPL